jgi:hypothetical protein
MVLIDAFTSQLRWRTEASGWAASAACPHHPTAGVGHSRGFFAFRTSYVGRRQHVTRTHVDEGRISTWWRMSFLATERSSTAGTITTDINVGPYGVVEHVEGTTDRGQCGDPGSSPAWMSCPCQPKMYWDKMVEGHGWSFKDHGNSTRAPIARGANVQSVCSATC